jgi:hypothetical protein
MAMKGFCFNNVFAILKLPRALITRHILGRTVGAPYDDDGQRDVVRAALDLLKDAHSPGTVEEFQAPYRPARNGSRNSPAL